jgi:hypothetical protein
MTSEYKQLAVELLNSAKEQPDNPPSTVAFIGIGYALLEIASQLEDQLQYGWGGHDIGNIVGLLDQIAHTPRNPPRAPWGS